MLLLGVGEGSNRGVAVSKYNHTRCSYAIVGVSDKMTNKCSKRRVFLINLEQCRTGFASRKQPE